MDDFIILNIFECVIKIEDPKENYALL